MSKTTINRGSIRIDLRRYRIIITKKAHRLMGEPKYILLLVNPDERTLAIIHSDETERRAHHIRKSKCGEIELNSKGLLKTMLSLSDNWQDNYSYKIYGTVSEGDNIMKFNIDDAVLTSSEKEEKDAD